LERGRSRRSSRHHPPRAFRSGDQRSAPDAAHHRRGPAQPERSRARREPERPLAAGVAGQRKGYGARAAEGRNHEPLRRRCPLRQRSPASREAPPRRRHLPDRQGARGPCRTLCGRRPFHGQSFPPHGRDQSRPADPAFVRDTPRERLHPRPDAGRAPRRAV